jgi:hypothetical protein
VINGRSLFGIFGLPAEYINLINFSSRKGWKQQYTVDNKWSHHKCHW